MESGNLKDGNSDLLAALENAAIVPAAEAKAASCVVVLAKREAGVRATVTFLERRGFAAKYVSSLNEAIEMFSKKEADKLLLSVNFAHPKVEMLPVLINQSFKVETILFAEETDRKTSNRLSNAKTKHVLFGPVSGPVVMMKVRQIDRELSGESDDSSASGDRRTLSSKEEESDIKVGGRKASNEGSVVLNSKTEKSAQASFDNLMKSLAEDEESSPQTKSSDSLGRSGETYVQKGQRSKMKSAGGDSVAQSDDNGLLSERAQNMRAGLDRGLIAAPENSSRRRLIMPNSFKRAASLLEIDQTAEGETVSAHEKAAQALRSAEHEQAVELAKQRAEREALDAARKSERTADLAKQKADSEALANQQRLEREQTAAQMKADREGSAVKTMADRETQDALRKAEREAADVEAKALAAKLPRTKAGEGAGATSTSSLSAILSDFQKSRLTLDEKIKRCLHESLAIVAGAPENEMHQLSEHAHAALISLRTNEMNCAFVVSLNYASQTANELFHRMEVAFFSLLRDYGVEFENNETYSIFLDNMNIVRDAFAGSEFAVITHTNEIEMGAAQVYVNDPVAKTEIYEENMHSINLRDLPLDEPVTFNLFLHFKRNHKFLRYLKIGSRISSRQIHRLERHQATGLVEQTEVEAFQRSFAAHAIQNPKKSAA